MTLQLHWRHQFQFAGYYMAKEKGYYRDAGFDVVFSERDGDLDGVEEVVKGRADFGVCDTRLVSEYLQGAPVVVLAAVLQHSPRVVVATEKSGIRSPKDLSGKRVLMAASKPDLDTAAMLGAHGVSVGQLSVLPHGAGIGALVDGTADACLGYLTDEPYELQKRGVPFVAFRASEYGADFYGELLFTSRLKARSRPERVRAFRDASMRGWAYAISHTQEAIDLIVRDYAPRADRQKLAFEARVFRSLMAADLIEIGHVNAVRWRHMVLTFAAQQSERAEEEGAGGAIDLIFDEKTAQPTSRWIRLLATGLLAVGVIAAALGLAVVLLRSLVNRRTAELRDANRLLSVENAERVRAESLLRLQCDLAVAIGEASSLQACLDRFVALTLRIPGIDCSGLYLVQPRGSQLELAAHRNIGAALAEAYAVIQPGTPAGDVVFQGKTLQLDRQGIEKLDEGTLRGGAFQTLMVVPVTYDSRIIASLHLASRDVPAFPPNTVTAVESLAMMMGGAIVRLRGKEEILRAKSDLEALFLTLEDMLFIVTLDGRILEASPSACRTLGYAREELVCLGLDRLHAAGDAASVAETMAGIIEGRVNVCALPIRRKDGTLLPVETKVVRGRWGGEDVLFGVSRDMRERLRAEESLRQSEERFRLIVEHAGVGLMVISEKGELLFHNGVMSLAGLSPEDSARLWPGLVSEQTCGAQYRARLQSVLATGKMTEYCNRLSLDGETRWLDIMMRPFPSGPQAPRSVLIMTKDVTEQRRILAALQESEANFRNLAENGMDLIAIIDREGRVIYASGRVVSMLGYTVEEAGGKPLRELVHPSQWMLIDARFKVRFADGPAPSHYETELLHKDGRMVPVELVSNLVVWHNETCIMVSVRDVSERRRAETALRESEAVFRSVAEGAFDAITVADTQGCYRYVNTRATAMFGYPREELLGSHFERLLHPNETRRMRAQFAKRLAGQAVPMVFETALCRKDGRPLPVEISVKECTLQGQRVFVSVYKDISERKRMEREILKISEWERTRIGQDLHDSIGQQLVGMAYLVEALEHDLVRSESPFAASATQVAQGCKTAHCQLRNVVRGLLPVRMGSGLPDGLRRLAEVVQAQMGAACTVCCEADVAGLSLSGMGHLYRIAQEAVTNAVRHGKARRLAIVVSRCNDLGELRIDDDGSGFCPLSEKGTGSGLKIMRYRADMVGGNLSVVRNEMGGMSVRCTFGIAQSMDLNQEVENDES